MSAGLIGEINGRLHDRTNAKTMEAPRTGSGGRACGYRTIFETHHKNTMATVRENSVLRVALREVQDASNWAYGVVADKLQRAT